jgi:hypothetical protein
LASLLAEEQVAAKDAHLPDASDIPFAMPEKTVAWGEVLIGDFEEVRGS